ncbi:MAG: hypothetical protein ACKV2V_20475, partial [Blastocatellia bacterium]
IFNGGLLAALLAPVAAWGQKKNVASAPAEKKGARKSAAGTSAIITPRGRIVCFTEAFARLHGLKPECEATRPLYGLQTGDQRLYSILPTDQAAAIYDDERFRQRDLRITARLFPGGAWIEVIKIQSLREGKLHDLYYFCEVCNIRTHKPGPCDCCQDPVVFHEEPADTDPV